MSEPTTPGRRLSGDEEVARLLREARVIAVIGCSANPERASHRVSAYLLRQGYRIYPVHPTWKEVHGLPVFRRLSDIPEHIDVVDVFRRPDATPEHAAEAVAVAVGALWLQLGIDHPESQRLALEGGLNYVADRCIMVEHRRLLGAVPGAAGPA
jgi:predicted CoA-binding protein